MSDELIIASTTDTPADIKAAMQHGIAPPTEDAVLSTEDETPAVKEPIVEDDKPPVEEEKPPVEGEKKPADEGKPPVAAKEKDEEDGLGARAQKRINRLVGEREAANRRADELEARLKALEDTKKPEEKAPAVKAAEADAHWLTANPEPTQDDGDDYETYSKKWTKWEMDRREVVAVRKAEDAGRAAAQKILDDKAAKDKSDAEAAGRTEAFQRFEAGKEEARDRYDDFDAVVTGAKDMKISGEMQYVIMDSPVGHDIAYWLAQHPDEADAIADLSGSEAIRELGRLERTIELQVASKSPKVAVVDPPAPPAKKEAATKAPAPIAPVGRGGATTTIDLADPNVDQVEWKRLRNQQDAARRQRR